MRHGSRWIVLGIATAVVAAYVPVLGAEFLGWDDDLYVTANPVVREPSLRSVVTAFTTAHVSGNWIPLTWLSHMADVALFGLAPAGHHATSLLLHVVNTLLVFHVMVRLTGARGASAGVAALFGLHPIHVESVAWVAGRKDLLCTLCLLAAIAAHERRARAPSRRRGWAVTAWFVAALLAKPTAVAAPLVLLLLDFWPLRRFGRAAVMEKLPLFACAAATAVVAYLTQRAGGALRAGATIGLEDRVANALVALARYVELTVWPARLSPWYSHPALEGAPLSAARIATAAVLVTAITVVAVRTRHTRPHLVVGWLWFVAMLLPVLGIVQIGGQAMAYRYMYLPLLGLAVALVFELARLRLGRVATAAAVVVLAILGVRTWQQTHVWHDTASLWEGTLAANPRAAVAYYGRAGLELRAGRVDAAILDYRRSLKLRPDYVNAHLAAAELLMQRRRLAAASAHYRKAIAALPDSADQHNNLGNILTQRRNLTAARRHFEIALRLRPQFPEAHNNLGIVLANQGDLAAAAREFRKALELKPDFAPAAKNLRAVTAELEDDGGAD
jgi:Tfp pilus assembly protein PilF